MTLGRSLCPTHHVAFSDGACCPQCPPVDEPEPELEDPGELVDDPSDYAWKRTADGYNVPPPSVTIEQYYVPSNPPGRRFEAIVPGVMGCGGTPMVALIDLSNKLEKHAAT